MSQNNNNNTTWPVPAKVIADIVECSPDMVNRVRSGDRGIRDTKLVEQIRVADLLVDEKKNLLLKEVKQIVKI